MYAKIVIMNWQYDSDQLCKDPLSVAPPCGRNSICKNPLLPGEHSQSEPWGVSKNCLLFSFTHCWQPASLVQCVLSRAPPLCKCSACSYLVRYVQAQTVNNGGEQTTTEPKNAPSSPTSKRRNICLIYDSFYVYPQGYGGALIVIFTIAQMAMQCCSRAT